MAKKSISEANLYLFSLGKNSLSLAKYIPIVRAEGQVKSHIDLIFKNELNLLEFNALKVFKIHY